MQLLDLTLSTPAENLAIDEALIEEAEAKGEVRETLRFWESKQTFVILGRSSPFQTEVNHRFCQQHNLPILRRCTGGATVVVGQGCLMYSLLLDLQQRPELRMIDNAHRLVMSQMIDVIETLGVASAMKGTCDLVHEGRKFSGNALRIKRNSMLYHGTLLTSLSTELIANCLAMPTRQPDYRSNRSHLDFVGCVPLKTEPFKKALAKAWEAEQIATDWPKELTKELVQKYQSQAWTEKL